MLAKSLMYQIAQNHLQNKQFAEALKVMMQWDNAQLAAFLSLHSNSLSIINNAIFDTFWAERLTALRLPTEPDFRFQEQPGLKNAEFVSGYLLFLLSLKSKSKNNGRRGKKLFKPADFLSFHSIRGDLHLIYLGLSEARVGDLIELMQTLYNLEVFAKLHRTPGYLLIANGYMQLAIHFKRLQLNERCAYAFERCWQYLHIAQLDEKESTASINNAYFGKGIVLATPFKLSTISEMKFHCQLIADSQLSINTQRIAEGAAKAMYKNILSLRPIGDVARP